MNHSVHVRLAADEITEDNLKGATIYGPDNETIGTIAHTHGSGPTCQVIVDVGGFLGIGSKRIAVSASEIDLMRDDCYSVHGVTDWTKDQLKDMPEHTD